MHYKEADRILAFVAERLEQERTRQGLSLQKLGTMSGVNRTMIAMIEKGQRSPSLVICLRIADALGLRLADVLNEVPAPKGRRQS
jgi:transcriptional regulator with XRE-family HTH domain